MPILEIYIYIYIYIYGKKEINSLYFLSDLSGVMVSVMVSLFNGISTFHGLSNAKAL